MSSSDTQTNEPTDEQCAAKIVADAQPSTAAASAAEHTPDERSQCAPSRALRYGNALVLVIATWWLLQTLALLVQAERLRTAMAAAAGAAKLPKATVDTILRTAERELAWASTAQPQVDLLFEGIPWQLASLYRRSAGVSKLVRAEVRATVASDRLLPSWLGPRLPGVGAEVFTVRWHAEDVARPF